jgi:hypothetical protein
MSTLSVTNLKHGSSASNNLVLDSSGNVTAAGTVAMATPYAMRNKIINGAMEIDQRNAGASVTLNTSQQFIVDRWYGIEDTDGTMTGQQSSTAPAGFINSIICTTGTADSSLSATQYSVLIQAIEGLNVADLAWGTASAKTVTLSFWVRSSLTGTFGGSLRNSGSTRSYPFTYTINSANTFEYKTVTIAGDTSGTWLTTNGLGISLAFGLGVGSTYSGTAGSWSGSNLLSATGAVSVIGTAGATFYLTGVQLEVGSVATPFERRLYPQELQLCQRYYSVQSVFSSLAALSGGVTTPVKYPVSMRASPTVSGSVTSQSGNAAGWPTLNGQDLNGGYVTMNPSGANTTISSTVNFIASIEL